jgi:hypothetical protein
MVFEPSPADGACRLQGGKCWRFWSAADAGVHYAVYQFPDMARLDAALKSDAFKGLVKDFDDTWPRGVTRTRDMVTMVEERSG